jgi:glycosyltransferase involved in cell wall biosynthesis
MRVTVAICTWNRANLLDQTLTRMRELRIPDGLEWELLVVNNNCTDDTDEVVGRHVPHLPIRLLHEPTPGKAHATNLVLEQSRGELILWTDDDVLVDPDWLKAYVAAARQWPEASYFGGAIEPWFEVNPPTWVLANLRLLEAMFAIKSGGGESRPIGEREFPWGANFATRKNVFDDVAFEPGLGPAGTSEIRGEEVALVSELRKRGHRGIWVCDARVKHFIPRYRLGRPYVWSYHVGAGRTAVRLKGRICRDGDRPEQVRQVLGMPTWVIRHYLEEYAKFLVLRCVGQTEWVVPFVKAALALGMLQEARAGARGGPHA